MDIKNKIEAIIFDMDGVLFDTESLYLKSWIKVFKKYGYTMEKEIYLDVMGTGRENVKKVFKEKFGDNLPIEEMYKEKDIELFKEIEENLEVKDGVLELLTYLKENNYKIALATSGERIRMEKQMKKANFIKFFDALVTKEDVNKNKPNPDIFLKAAEKINVEPKKCMVIEDSFAGIKGAYLGNMIPVHVIDLKELDEEGKKLCYKTYKNLIELKGELF